ncbi:hypothetical protein PGTUg99_002816 [Puccinia graminis f. sp. tritici]|uniref:Uncharacterized protein n=1 Tax=Puccinia graminis f. sp. tritici TaxID=56615 RepID=A0A5B0RFB4_PUCGR|nr:hypothetical protein PGTUg99_002816 [Puccinia graminis f. sp. tritici]
MTERYSLWPQPATHRLDISSKPRASETANTDSPPHTDLTSAVNATVLLRVRMNKLHQNWQTAGVQTKDVGLSKAPKHLTREFRDNAPVDDVNPIHSSNNRLQYVSNKHFAYDQIIRTAPRFLNQIESNIRPLNNSAMEQTHHQANETGPQAACRGCRRIGAVQPCVYDVDRGTCELCESTGQMCDTRPGKSNDYRVEKQIIRRLLRTHNHLQRARARIIQRPGMNGTSFLTDVLLRRIRAEISRLEQIVFDMRGEEVLGIWEP